MRIDKKHRRRLACASALVCSVTLLLTACSDPESPAESGFETGRTSIGSVCTFLSGDTWQTDRKTQNAQIETGNSSASDPLIQTAAAAQGQTTSLPPASIPSYITSSTSFVVPSSAASTTTRPSAWRPQTETVGSKGVWWWDIGQIHGETGEQYLCFLEKNGVTEIYLCVDGMRMSGGSASYAEVRNFVRRAGGLGIRVAALTGEISWIDPENNGFQGFVDRLTEYQGTVSADEQFYAMHLDVEPHQHGSFSSDRGFVMQRFADFILERAAPAARKAGLLLEWDIPFWLEDTVADANGTSTDLLELMAKTCDTLVVMAYRDTADGMYGISVEEIAAARKYGCKIVLGAESSSSEGEQVSFKEEGKAAMAVELRNLEKRLSADFPDGNYGLAVHHLTSWYLLKD